MSSDPEGAGTAAPAQSDVSTGEGVGPSPKGDVGDKGRADRARERFRSLPTHTFGPASEEPYRRRTSDWVRVVVAVVALALLVAYHDNPSHANQDLFRFFNGLPDDLQPFFQTLYWAGTLWTVLVVAAAAFIGRRWRLARDLTIAGVLAAVAARAMAQLVDEQSLSKTFDEVTRLGQSPQFPLVRLAVVAAVVAAASPYVTRPTRRLGQLLVFALGVLGDVSGDGVSERHPRGAVPRVGRRRARAPRVRFAGRASDHASGGGVACGARCDGARRASGSDAADRRVAVPRAGRSRPVVGPCHRSRRGRQPVLRQVVAVRGLQGLRSAAVPDPRAGRGARGLHSCCSPSAQAVQVPDVIVAGTAGPGAALIVGRSSERPCPRRSEP